MKSFNLFSQIFIFGKYLTNCLSTKFENQKQKTLEKANAG